MNASTFFATAAALSIAVERVIEIFKQMCGSWPVIRLLFTPFPMAKKENFRCACLHLLSAIVGGIIAGVSNIQILPNAQHPYFSYAVAGLLSSGGSAFWNHALDMMQAAKIQKEQDAVAAVQTSIAAPVIAGVPVQ